MKEVEDPFFTRMRLLYFLTDGNIVPDNPQLHGYRDRKRTELKRKYIGTDSIETEAQ